MIMLSRAEMIQIAIDQYFARITKDTIPETLEFFHPDATFTLYPSGRLFRGHDEIAAMYTEVFGRHERIEREVVDVAVDHEANIVSASFRATAYPRNGSKYIMHNVNFWQFEGRKFSGIKVYSSDAAL